MGMGYGYMGFLASQIEIDGYEHMDWVLGLNPYTHTHHIETHIDYFECDALKKN